MMLPLLKMLFSRDLQKLKTEIELYQNEETIWHTERGIANSAGNLCLHLIGNLNTYLGAEFGKTNYVRHRDLEFSTKGTPRQELVRMIEETISTVSRSLDNVSEAQLADDYPTLVFEKPTSTAYLLMHLTTHLTYHLGQVNYHRRLLDA